MVLFKSRKFTEYGSTVKKKKKKKKKTSTGYCLKQREWACLYIFESIFILDLHFEIEIGISNIFWNRLSNFDPLAAHDTRKLRMSGITEAVDLHLDFASNGHVDSDDDERSVGKLTIYDNNNLFLRPGLLAGDIYNSDINANVLYERVQCMRSLREFRKCFWKQN